MVYIKFKESKRKINVSGSLRPWLKRRVPGRSIIMWSEKVGRLQDSYDDLKRFR